MAETEQLTVGVVKESRPGERRVSLVPKLIERLTKRGLRIVVESGTGEGAYLADSVFEEAGAVIGDAWGADVVLKVEPPTADEVAKLKTGTLLIGFLNPRSDPDGITALERRGCARSPSKPFPIFPARRRWTLPARRRWTRFRRKVVSRVIARYCWPQRNCRSSSRCFTTAAGTVPPAKVLVLGAGVAGLQALATAKRLGAQTTGYDVRPEVGERVKSLGAKFLELGIEASGEGGYARELTEEERAEQQRRLTDAITKFDVVITTALVPGRKAPTLVTAEAVKGMPAGAVVVDLAGESGGNCELTKPGEDVVEYDVTITSPLNLPAHASELYARNVTELLELIVDKEGKLALDFSDEIVAGACVAGKGAE